MIKDIMKSLKTKTTKLIEVQNWDALVEETYGRPYSFQQQDGCKSRGVFKFSIPNSDICDFENNSVPETVNIVNHDEMGVSFKAWLSRNPEQRLLDSENQQSYVIKLWWMRNFYPHVSMIINDLANKGILESGNYIINIDW